MRAIEPVFVGACVRACSSECARVCVCVCARVVVVVVVSVIVAVVIGSGSCCCGNVRVCVRVRWMDASDK